jgi:3-oxoacyl-[acyl-carrier protein] reductase
MDGVDRRAVAANARRVRTLLARVGLDMVCGHDLDGRATGAAQADRVARDLAALRACDFVLADCSRRGHQYVGVVAELVYGHLFGKPVVACVGSSGVGTRAWLAHHATRIVKTIEEGVEALRLIRQGFAALGPNVPQPCHLSETGHAAETMVGTPLLGLHAVVTGGSRGIGAAVVVRLAQLGADVGINHVHKTRAHLARSVARQVHALGRQARISRGDVSDESYVSAMVRDFERALGPIHILINNAGIAPPRPGRLLHEVSSTEWNRVLAVNLNGAYYCSKVVLERMVRTGVSGVVVNVGSVASFGGGASTGAHYVASKCALLGMTYVLAAQYGQYGIRVNAVCPGMTDTDLARALPQERLAWHISNTPLGRIASPAEAAEAVVAMATMHFVTGQSLVVDGGRLRR